MKRYTAYDPPEYVDWRPDPEVMESFRERLIADPERAALLAGAPASLHLILYAGLLRNRLHDIALKRWVKQGVLSKAWLGTGEEASTIGAVHALEPGDHVGPMIRNAGACHERGMPVADLFRAYLGTYDTITKGRDLHTGDPSLGIIPPISMVGALVPIFAGIGLAFRIQSKPNVALTWIGDGATRTWEFHEGANFASVQRLPVIFVVQNNLVALGTGLSEGVAGDLGSLHELYGARGLRCDGNNVLDVWAATRIAARACRRGDGPVFLLAETFRMGGHATHDEAEARQLFSQETFAFWGRRDPVGTYEAWLVESGPPLAPSLGDKSLAHAMGLDPDAAAWRTRGGAGNSTVGGARSAETARENERIMEAVEQHVIHEVDAAAQDALRSRETAQPRPETALEGVHASPGEGGSPGRARGLEDPKL